VVTESLPVLNEFHFMASAAADLVPDFMDLAFKQAEAAGARGEVPVGAVLVDVTSGQIIAAAGNETEARSDPTAHAEVLVIRAAAAKVGTPRLPSCDLYVTLEPCAMCAGAVSLARIRRVIYGAYDPKGGGVDHGARVFSHPTCHHKPEVVGGVAASRAEALLKDFFALRR
jgi:tRNA(adenine34) deaminase